MAFYHIDMEVCCEYISASRMQMSYECVNILCICECFL